MVPDLASGLPWAGSSDGFTLHDLTPALLIGSLVLLVSVGAVRLSPTCYRRFKSQAGTAPRGDLSVIS